ncbi:hypothetical protein G6W51_08195 [Streptomyces coelicolor]|nr:hypothetical protein [Streptomyces coelicolor]
MDKEAVGPVASSKRSSRFRITTAPPIGRLRTASSRITHGSGRSDNLNRSSHPTA